MWMCNECGSDAVEVKAWVNLKTDRPDLSDWSDHETYCAKCEGQAELVYVVDAEPPKKTPQVTHGVILDGEEITHPLGVQDPRPLGDRGEGA